MVRKCFGYHHIPQRWAPLINEFNQQQLNSCINFHCPCFFPETRIDGKDRQRKIYRYENMMILYDKLKSLPNAEGYLKSDVSFEIFDEVAPSLSDNYPDRGGLQKAQKKLFQYHSWADFKNRLTSTDSFSLQTHLSIGKYYERNCINQYC